MKKINRKKRGTKTSSFGSPGRINHDSTAFYASKLYEGLPKEQKVKYIENSIPSDFLDRIFCKSSENMKELPDNSIHLMVTSPPYFNAPCGVPSFLVPPIMRDFPPFPKVA